MSIKPKDFHLILSISDNRNSHLTRQVPNLPTFIFGVILDFTSEWPTNLNCITFFFNFDSLIVSTVLAMGMPGPGVDHTDSASSHFMFVKKKDETAKGGLLYFFVNISQTWFALCWFLTPQGSLSCGGQPLQSPTRSACWRSGLTSRTTSPSIPPCTTSSWTSTQTWRSLTMWSWWRTPGTGEN